MISEISKLKIIVMNKETHHPISDAEIYWDKIPEGIRNKSVYCKKYKNSENGLKIDVSNRAGFSILWGELVRKTQLWFYIRKINRPGFKEEMIERKFAVKGGSEREITIYLTVDNKNAIK